MNHNGNIKVNKKNKNKNQTIFKITKSITQMITVQHPTTPTIDYKIYSWGYGTVECCCAHDKMISCNVYL